MTVLVVRSESSVRHDTGQWHPERAARLTATTAALSDPELDGALRFVEARQATDDELHMVHTPEHVARIRVVCGSGGGSLDAATPVVAMDGLPESGRRGPEAHDGRVATAGYANARRMAARDGQGMPPGRAASGVRCGVERIADPSVGAPGSESGGCRERHGSPAGVRGGVRPRSHCWVWV